MKNITSRHSEYIAVRVALGVIVLLFLLSLAAPSSQDYTFRMGLRHLAEAVRLKYPKAAPGYQVQELLNKQVQVWKKGSGDESKAVEEVLWLDLQQVVYCNGFSYGDGNC